MANHTTVLKRARQSVKRHAINRADKSRMRTFTKRVLTTVASGDVTAAQEAFREAMSIVAITARKGVIHPNQAARRIKRLHAKVKQMSVAA